MVFSSADASKVPWGVLENAGATESSPLLRDAALAEAVAGVTVVWKSYAYYRKLKK